jgi:L-fuconolactonase
MPNFAIVDTHVHLWNPQYFRMSWLDNNLIINARFMGEEFTQHTRDVAIEAMVYVEVAVEPQYSLLEAQYINTVARQLPKLKGIVAVPQSNLASKPCHYSALTAICRASKGCVAYFKVNPMPISPSCPNVVSWGSNYSPNTA